MKNLLLFLVTIFTLINTCSVINAANASYFGSGASEFSNNSSKISTPHTNRVHSNRYYGNVDPNNVYYNPSFDYYNSTVSLIYAKSICDTPIESYLRSVYKAQNSSSTRYYLDNGQIWKQYIYFGGQVLNQIVSYYKYTDYYHSKMPKVKIYRDATTNACKIIINGNDSGAFVYREN